MSRAWPSSFYAVDYRPRTIEAEDEARFPPRYRLPAWPEGQDFESMVAKHGRPIGPFEKERHHLYRAFRSSADAAAST